MDPDLGVRNHTRGHKMNLRGFVMIDKIGNTVHLLNF